jgi:hypothetical protein
VADPMPAMISAAATAKLQSTGSPSSMAALAMPTIGVAVVPSDVVKAEMLLLTIDIAQ